MENEKTGIISHLSTGTNDFDHAIAYDREFPEFWVPTLIDGKPATVDNGFHKLPENELVASFGKKSFRRRYRPALPELTAR